MEVISNSELGSINGGGKTLWLVVGGIALFVFGVFCGFFEK